MSEFTKSEQRTWRVRCPDCLGRSTRTEGAWSMTEIPRVVWKCPTCDGKGMVTVRQAQDTGPVVTEKMKLRAIQAVNTGVHHELRPPVLGNVVTVALEAALSSKPTPPLLHDYKGGEGSDG